MRPLSIVAALAAAVLVFAACGTKKDVIGSRGSAQRVDLVLDYVPNADHAGIYEAIRSGAFARAGLDVHPIVPSDPAAPLKLLATGRAAMAISYEPELLLARDRGLPLVAFAALVQRPLTSIMSIGRKPVRRVADLAGRTVGTAGIAYQTAYLRTVLRHAGMPPTAAREVNVGFNLVPAMLGRKVGATLGAFWNVEGVQLQRQHRRPTIIPIDRAGVPTYDELVLVARSQDLRTRGALFRSFMHALAEGHEALRRDPRSGVDALHAADSSLDAGDTLASVRATLPAFFPPPGKPFGYLDYAQWARYGKWMLDNGLVTRPPTPLSLTDEFLPGQGLRTAG